jgi:predicted ATPase/class 3 adenylate cyclase
MVDRPTGTVTFLFTDIEGSTRLLQQLGDAYAGVLTDHHRLLRSAVAAAGGAEVKTEGDSFFVVFHTATDAVNAAVDAQRALASHDWPSGHDVRVRMGIHTGGVALAGDEYVGLDVHRAARIAAAAHGGQVILSDAVRELVDASLPDGVSLRDLGEHRLRDLERSERLHQLVVDGLRSDFPPPATLDARLDILPSQLTSFIGREREVAQVEHLLAGTRLLTLTGPGGTGKTRLALAVARRAREDFHDGVVFVELAPITDPALVGPTIRQRMRLAEDAERGPIDTVAEAIGAKEVLLVLDNFEQVLPAASVVGELLQRIEHLSVLVTSRSALHLTGEQEYPVPPLELPDPVDVSDPERISQSEAVALFLQRARTVRPDFSVTPQNAHAIVEICRRLDGLPLAIELAASRVKLLPPDALLARMKHRLDLLQSSATDRTDRQRTLRGAIDWSYGLLPAGDQAVFRRLAIFMGGWTIAAAERVVPAAGIVGDVLDGIATLVDHSLVRQRDEDGEPRFTMLETIREFASEQLDASEERTATAAAHGRYLCDLAAEEEPRLTAGTDALDRLEREHDNLRVALRWAAESGETRLALTTAAAMWRFWHLRGHLREGSRRVEELLRLPGAEAPTAERARALIGLAGLVYWMGDYAAALRAYEEALPITRATGDRRLEAEVHYSLGYVRAIGRDWAGAREAYTEARRLYGELGDQLGDGSALMAIGMVDSLSGSHDDSKVELEEAIDLFERLGERFARGNAMAVLTRNLMHLGEWDRAREWNRQALRLYSEARDPTGLSGAILDLATLEARAGQSERAARLVGAGARLVETSGGQAPPELVNRIDPMPLIRERLTEADFERAVAEGRQWSLDDAIAYARESTEVIAG